MRISESGATYAPWEKPLEPPPVTAPPYAPTAPAPAPTRPWEGPAYWWQQQPAPAPLRPTPAPMPTPYAPTPSPWSNNIPTLGTTPVYGPPAPGPTDLNWKRKAKNSRYHRPSIAGLTPPPAPSVLPPPAPPDADNAWSGGGGGWGGGWGGGGGGGYSRSSWIQSLYSLNVNR